MLKELALVVTGAVGALALVVACGDDGPADADAAACACDPAEPPLAGRIVRREDRRTGSTQSLFAGVMCPQGAVLLGGGCYGEGVAATVRLRDAGSAEGDPLSWVCSWTNEPAEETTVVAWVNCLLPAP